MSKQRFLLLILAPLLGLVMVSCDDTKIYDESKSIDNNVWKADDKKTFQFNIEDTLSPVNIYVNLRTTTDYAYSNIYVFLYSKYPNGVSDKDTLEFILADPDGKWKGEATGTVVEFTGLIASGGRFSTSGEYTFELQHAMREEELPEVIDVGLRVAYFEAGSND